MASNFISPCFPHFFLFQMHFLPTSSPPKMHFPSDHKSLHNCPARLRQLARRGHKAVLRPSSRGIDAQLSSLWGWPDIQPSSPLQLVSSSLWGCWSTSQFYPFLATDLLYLQHNSLQTRQSTDIPCSRSLTQPRQAEKWRARSQGLPAYAWTETEWKVKLVLWKPQTLMLQYPV